MPTMPSSTRVKKSSVPAGHLPVSSDSLLKSRFSDQSLEGTPSGKKTWLGGAGLLGGSRGKGREESPKTEVSRPNTQESSLVPIINVSSQPTTVDDPDESDYITVLNNSNSTSQQLQQQQQSDALSLRHDKASRVLGIRHRRSMEPIPASTRNSIVSSRSLRDIRDIPPVTHTPNLPLTSLYVVSGLPKSPHTWTLADPDSVMGLHHSEGAVSRWWRPEVLGSTVSPGAGGGKKKRRGKEEITKGAGALSKQEVGKMLSKALKLSFTREVEVIASTLQPASTIHTFTFSLPAPNTPLAPTPSGDLLRASVLSNADHRSSAATFSYPYSDDPFARPSSAYLGPQSLLPRGPHAPPSSGPAVSTTDLNPSSNNVVYHGVCLTVWSHADAERSAAIRRTLESGRSRKESAQSVLTSRLRHLRSDLSGSVSDADPSFQARRQARKSARGPWGDADTDIETEAEGAISESEFEVASTIGHGPGESTLFLPGDTVFWLPYALTLVSRHPVYDLMRDYLTLSWARFSKDVQSHTLQISKILAHPAPRAGELVKLDASPKTDGGESNLEVIARFPGGLDFGRGLVDINFTMWPLFKCLNIDNILTLCEIALAPTGRILFFSRYPAMLGIAVNTIKYLVELRGWSGIALPAVHSRDAKIYIDDPGPWIMGLATEGRYSIRPSAEVCVCDLDINYLSCPSPPPGVVSQKQQREKYRQRLIAAFESHYHPDHCIPSEFKEAFPAGRFRPICKIQAKRGASSAAVADQIKPPDWWNSTRVIQAFDAVLADKFKKPSLFKRITSFGTPRRAPHLSAAEQHIQHSIRKRATAFVDARDELETKIGRLSRRLNFLMTESDLWRDKFATFEQYAEKLSTEATQLRAKINKEHRETKRLSGLVTLTAAEKAKLQTQLRQTENEHREALLELERMRNKMEQMEEEREEMIAEVEVQIERALASMAVDVDVDESDYGSSRPQSRVSARSGRSGARSRSRHASDASKARYLRSFATDSTLAETYGEEEEAALEEALASQRARNSNDGAEEESNDNDKTANHDASSLKKKKRFSASEMDLQQDGMIAVDEGISLKSDKITRKMLDIQEKLESALAAERAALANAESGDEDAVPPRLPRAKRGPSKTSNKKSGRGRSGTASSTQTTRTTTPLAHIEETAGSYPPAPYSTTKINSSKAQQRSGRSSYEAAGMTPTRETFERDFNGDEDHTPEPLTPETILEVTEELPSSKDVADGVSLKRMSMHADDSDTDFQSAYSTSPRNSYARAGNDSESDDLDDLPPSSFLNRRPSAIEKPSTMPRPIISASS